jgi:hypothetical protein
MSRTGRPSIFSDEIANEICARLIEGKSLRTICDDEEMPGLRTVMTWLSEKEKFRQQYTRAKEEQADVLAEEILYIADTPQVGIKTKTAGDKVEVQEGDMIEHRKLQVDARKWIAARLKPKKYGDKSEQTL